MANKAALRELQTRLAERLQQARSEARPQSWLAVEAGGLGLLFPLQDAGEIFPLSTLMPVPHAHAWFAGVANLRGGLYGVVDLAAFLREGGGAPGPAGAAPWNGEERRKKAAAGEGEAGYDAAREQARLVALNPALECNAALLIERLSGLRHHDRMTRQPEESSSLRPAFAGDRYRDETGRIWQELRLAALASNPAFLSIVA